MINSDQNIWLSVVVRAVLDAGYAPPARKPKSRQARNRVLAQIVERDRADQWLRTCSADFRHVCCLAGLDADFIREAYVAGRIDLAALKASEETKRARK